MPYDKADAAAWWRGAEALPPAPDGPGPWEQVATPYGWEWRKAEPDEPRPVRVFRLESVRIMLNGVEIGCGPGVEPDGVPKPSAAGPFVPTSAGTYKVVRTPDGWELRRDGDGSGAIVGAETFSVSAPPDAPPPLAAVRVSDRIVCPRQTMRVDSIIDAVAVQATCISQPGLGSRGIVPLVEIGPAGSGKPWTLLPRDSVPTAPAGITIATPIHSGMCIVNVAPPEPDRGRGETVAFLRAVDAAPPVSGGGGGSGPNAVFEARVEAACDAYDRAGSSRGSRGAMAQSLRAADAVPDPRRALERRVIQTARAVRNETLATGGYRRTMSALNDALDALAALDGEGGQ